MQPPASHKLLEMAARWDDLSRWERAELGRSLRRLGWSYGEIMELIPVPKGTLAYWCRSIELTATQKEAIRERTGSLKGVPRDTQRRRRQEVERIRSGAAAEVEDRLLDPGWLAGTVMYWAEGAKTERRLQMANSDPRVLLLFMGWTAAYLDPSPSWVVQLHLHEGNDETAAREHWVSALDLMAPEFYKTFIKPKGTGYRKNRLAHGVCTLRLRRSADAWVRTQGWIDGLAAVFGQPRVFG